MAVGTMEVEVPQIVVLRNVGSRVFTVRHNKRKWDILPGADFHVPWEAAASFLGDPRAVDVGRNKFRRVLYDQTRALNNFYLGFDTETIPQAQEKFAATGIPTSSWEEKKPQLEVYTIEGRRIYMLLDDPDGVEENPWGRVAMPVDSTNTAVLEAQVQRLQSQIDQLVHVIASRTPDLAAQISEPAPTPVPIDTSDGISDAELKTFFNPIPSAPPSQSVGRIPDMNDGIRSNLMPLTSAHLPSPDELFSDDASLPSAPSDTSIILPDSPRTTKPVAKSSKSASPRPRT